MPPNKKQPSSKLRNNLIEKMQFVLFLTSIAFFSMCYGMAAASLGIFPVPLFNKLKDDATSLLPNSLMLSLVTQHTKQTKQIKNLLPEKIQPGLTKLTGFWEDYELKVKVIDSLGNQIHLWEINWFDIWPDATHVNVEDIPKRKPGTLIHGSQILENGDLVFNFEYMGLVRMNPCGKVVWKLPYQTHHSLFIDDDNNIWVGNRTKHKQKKPGLTSINPPFSESFILKVSPEGKVLMEKSLFDLLIENNQQGQLYLSGLGGVRVSAKGDLLHLNDIEVFSKNMEPGFFKPGDVMISLRNTNTIMVFDQKNWKLKYRISDAFISQHDPDFIDGNTISIFDNNNIANKKERAYSRIVSIDVVKNKISIPFQGTKKLPVYTEIMGKHQWLDNGNLLFTESLAGRGFEVTPEGQIAWEYNNLVEPGIALALQDVQRLPVNMNEAFFNNAQSSCLSE